MAQYCYNFFFPDFFAAAQRAFIAAAMRLRAAADMVRRRAGVGVFAFPGGRPRRFVLLLGPLPPSNARMAISSLSRSCLSCRTISSMFMRVS